MTPGTEQRRLRHTPRCARNSTATDPKGDLSLLPRAGRGKHLAKPVPQTTLGSLAQAPAGLSGSAPSRASASRPFGFNLPSPCSACRKVKSTCSTSPQAATCCTLKPNQRRPAARRTGEHGPFDAPRGALWGPRWCWYCRKHIFVVESCLSLLFGVAPVARQKSRASWLRRRHILETPDRPLAAARLCIRRLRNPSCHVPFTGLGPVG
ncbi:MAG: hypothetical protein GAKPKEKM_02938 [Rhodocyclaceae bacterium]|nr:hypothetical protein [Rhodocyclaceae bacterium]